MYLFPRWPHEISDISPHTQNPALHMRCLLCLLHCGRSCSGICVDHEQQGCKQSAACTAFVYPCSQVISHAEAHAESSAFSWSWSPETGNITHEAKSEAHAIADSVNGTAKVCIGAVGDIIICLARYTPILPHCRANNNLFCCITEV